MADTLAGYVPAAPHLLLDDPPEAEKRVEQQAMRDLIAQLDAEVSEDVLEAAYELGERNDPAAIDPLIRTLSRFTYEDDYGGRPDEYCAGAIIGALMSLGDARACPAIRDALDRAGPSDLVSPVACQALVRLHDVSAVPILKRLLVDPESWYVAEDLAGALIELGGEDEAVFLVGLLGAEEELYVGAVARALGKKRYGPAAAALSALRTAEAVESRIWAFDALVAMGEVDTDGIDQQMFRAESRRERDQLVRTLARYRVIAAATLLLHYAADPEWVGGVDELRVKAVTTAAVLGSVDAVDRLRVIASDHGESPGSRALAVQTLLDLDHSEFLDAGLDFLRSDGAGADERMVATVARFAARHRDAFLPVVDVLDVLRRGKSSSAQQRAWGLVPTMTETETYAEFDEWRAAQG